MSTVDTTELLAQLRDIHLPAAPVAPALWPVAVAAAIIVVALVTLLLQRHSNRKPWATEAISQLKSIQRSGSPESLYRIALLLKRIALTADSAGKTKHLSGSKWLSYLDTFFNTRYFSQGNGRVFGSDLYQKNTSIDETIYSELTWLIRRRQWFHD